MIWEILVSVTVLSCPVHGSLQITDNEYSLMDYTKLVSEEHFIAGRPLVIFLPLAEAGTNIEGVGYFIEKLHATGRWSILLYNWDYEMKVNMYTEMHQHGSYIILIPGPCVELEFYIRSISQQLNYFYFQL
jgi:hypothetical protein